MKKKTVIVFIEGSERSIRIFKNAKSLYPIVCKYCRYTCSLRQFQRQIEAGDMKM